MTDATTRRRGEQGARWRVAARLARRQLRRTWASSLLVALMVALPIAGMVAFAVYSASRIATPAEQVATELGAAQAWVAPVGIPDGGFWQAPTQPDWIGYPIADDGSMDIPEGAPLHDPVAALPAGTTALPISTNGVEVTTPDGTAAVTAWAGRVWDPSLTGAFDLVAGDRPRTGTEAMVTPAALDRLGLDIGGGLALAGDTQTYTVVGTLDAAILPDSTAAVFLPESALELVGGERRWYLPDQALTWTDVQRLNDDGIVAYSRAVVLDPPLFENAFVRGAALDAWAQLWPLVLALSIAGLFAGYVVVMLAGAAFAVSARRQQRALAIAASVGADRRDLSRTILLQGTTLGIVGGAAGIASGIGLAALVMGVTNDGSATLFWGFHVPWAVLAGIAVFAVVVGTVSAWMPARAVARRPPLQALRGARRPQKPTASRPLWGSALILGGVALTILSALISAAIVATDALPGDNGWRYVPPYGIAVGPIVAQIGILMSGRWLVWQASRALSHVGTAAKIAARDAAANASRTVPAFAAVTATVFVGVFAIGLSSMQTSQTARTWFYTAPVGSVAVSIWTAPGPDASEQAAEAVATAERLVVDAGGSAPAVLARQQTPTQYAERSDVPDGTFALAILPERYLIETTQSYQSTGRDPWNPIAVVAPEDVGTALGVEPSARDLAAYRAGAALVADERFITDETVRVQSFDNVDVSDTRVPDNVWVRASDAPALAAPVRSDTLDAIAVDAPHQPLSVLIAPATAERLGIVSQPDRIVAALPTRSDPSALDQLRAQSDLAGAEASTLSVNVETGPPSAAAWVVPLLGVMAVLVLGASAVALGLARFERRPDDATLAAVGGTPGLRRRIGFWQGLIIAGFGTIAGAAVGILPPIGFALQSQGTLRLDDLPWTVIAGVAALLPLVIAVANALVPPRRPDLTRRTAIA